MVLYRYGVGTLSKQLRARRIAMGVGRYCTLEYPFGYIYMTRSTLGLELHTTSSTSNSSVLVFLSLTKPNNRRTFSPATGFSPPLFLTKFSSYLPCSVRGGRNGCMYVVHTLASSILPT